MAKKQNFSNEKKKKTPFNVFSKKGLMALAVAGVMIASPLMLAGCSDGKDGQNGADGTIWRVGYDYSEFTDAKVGDFFIDKNDFILYQKTADSWIIVMENYGRPGPNGQDGTDGINGQNGAAWLTGTAITGEGTGISATIEYSKVGDLYFNIDTCDVYQCAAENTWNWIANIKGDKGETGVTGPQGPAGQDGVSVYIGYDGYVWENDTRTKYQIADVVGVDGVVENTLELKDNKFFTESLVDTTTSQVALMSNYYQYIGKVGYSETTLQKISFYSNAAGKLTIGTASLSDLKTARESDENVEISNAKTVNVVKGLNSINIELNVGTYETIVLGGGETNVKLVKTSGVDVDDEHGLYSLIGDSSSAEMFAKTNGINDKLLIKTAIKTTEYVELEDNYRATYDNLSGAASISAANGSAPWLHDQCSGDDNPYENTTITRIDIPIGKVSAVDANQIIKIAIVDKTTLVVGGTVTIKQTIDLNLPYEQIKDAASDGSLNKWISFTGLNIEMGENDTLGIGGSGSTVNVMFRSNANDGGSWVSKPATAVAKEGYEMFYTAYTSVETSVNEHLNTLVDAENLELKKLEILLGKKVSILGDSISTYKGYSNDSENTNSTIGNNAIWYGNVGTLQAEETWWMQLLNDLKMDLCVNNSASGSQVWDTATSAGYNTRVENLHDNTGEDAGTNPDIILIYMGINDILNDTNYTTNLGTFENIDFSSLITDNGDSTYTYATPTTFSEAYAITIHKATTLYGADVFCFTPQNAVSKDQKPYLAIMVDIITKVANHFDAGLVDLYNDSGVTAVHPDATGMDKITELVKEAIIKKLVK